MPFLRRRQEDEPELSASEPAVPESAPEPEPPAPVEPPEPAPPPEPAVESQFQPVEGADEMLDMPLGTLIFRAGLIAPQQLEDALAEGLRTGKRLGEVLLGRGWLSEEDLSRLLAGQKGLPYADVEKVAVDRELARIMTYDDARAEMALPLVNEFGAPVVVMADPDDAAMERLRAQVGNDTRFVVGAPSAIARLIDEVLGDKGVPAPTLVVAAGAEEPSPAPEPALDQMPVESPGEPEPALEPEAATEAAAEAPVEGPALEEISQPETVPIVGEDEIDYPTFPEYESISAAETITPPEEQLPAEVQMGEYGYYGDSSLIEGSAWQADDSWESTAEGAETSEQEEAAPEELPTTAEEEPALESALEAEPTPVPPFEEESGADITTPAWMRGQVNVITADVADFIDSGAGFAEDEQVSAPPSAADWGGGDSTAAENAIEEPEPGGLVEPSYVEPDSPEELEPSPEPGPELEPESEPELAVESAADTEPAIEPEPESVGTVLGAGLSEPVGDAEYAPTEVSDSEPEPEPTLVSAEHAGGSAVYELILRLSDSDRVEIGMFATLDEAQERAGEVVRQFAEAKDGTWPFIAGRYLRPETIVSIDIEEHGSGWSGSGSRGRMFSGGGESGESPS